MIEQSCTSWLADLASSKPAPGGGGAAALVGAVGVSLGAMVGRLTIGKKKYADVEEEMLNLKQKADRLQEDLLMLIQKDADGFEPLAKAYGMPKDTEEEKKAKAIVMEKALKDACEVPIKIMEKCCEAIELQKEFAMKGSLLAVSDAGVGVALCKSALMGASLNVFINTKSMSDEEYALKTNNYANEMLDKYTKMADEIFDYVLNKLK